MDATTGRADWSRKVHHELYDLRGGNSFDLDGMSYNVADLHKDYVHDLSLRLEEAVKTWY